MVHIKERASGGDGEGQAKSRGMRRRASVLKRGLKTREPRPQYLRYERFDTQEAAYVG